MNARRSTEQRIARRQARARRARAQIRNDRLANVYAAALLTASTLGWALGIAGQVGG